MIQALFPARSETGEARSKRFLSLLEFAKAKVGECDELKLAGEGWEPAEGLSASGVGAIGFRGR